ncbi:hypothetical protein ALMP_25970 [Streptomyces sp. A012304]|nr:hypothetical protein ALMP_25970 [Streptomyces sp. A012304]
MPVRRAPGFACVVAGMQTRWTPRAPSPLRETAVYVPAQIVGAIAGAILADAMLGEPLVTWSTHDRSAG